MPQVIISGECVDAEGDDLWVEIAAPNGWDDLQTGDCPDCHGLWVWAEAGCVPGTRTCLNCGSLFNVKPQAGKGILVRERFY